MKIYRICSAKFPANDGVGAGIAGGRWNHKGTRLVYCAATPSLCQLEVLVHAAALPKDKMMIEVDVPDSIKIRVVTDAELSPKWKSAVYLKKTQDLGTRWAKAKRTAVMSVPSAVSPLERNFLLNPSHPDFSRIVFAKPVAFEFDPRLK